MIPLPEPYGHIRCDMRGNAMEALGYTADQMRAHEAAARRQALEDAAKRVDAAIGEAIAGHFNKQAISALMQTRDMLRDGELLDKEPAHG